MQRGFAQGACDRSTILGRKPPSKLRNASTNSGDVTRTITSGISLNHRGKP